MGRVMAGGNRAGTGGQATGGGRSGFVRLTELLTGIDLRLEHETGMPVRIAPDPLYAVALGSGQSLEEFDALKGVLFSANVSS